VVLKLSWALKPLRELIKAHFWALFPRFLIQKVWAGDQKPAFLTGFQVMLMLQAKQ
jgi:hypothetical protein